MLQQASKAVLVAGSLLFASSFATADSIRCQYSDKTSVKTMGKIDEIRNFSYTIHDNSDKNTPNFGENRVCAVKMDVKIDETWHEVGNWYMFGPDISQNDACEIAKDKAKVYALQKHVPQIVESETEHGCEETIGERPKPVEIIVEKEVIVYRDSDTGALIHNKECPECVINPYVQQGYKDPPRKERTISIFDIFTFGSIFISR